MHSYGVLVGHGASDVKERKRRKRVVINWFHLITVGTASVHGEAKVTFITRLAGFSLR